MSAQTGIRFELGLQPGDRRTRFELIDRTTAWRLDRRRSSVSLHLDGRPTGLAGHFRAVSGQVHFDEDDPARSRVGVELELLPAPDSESGSPHRERRGPAHRQNDTEGLAMTFWTSDVQAESDSHLQVTGQVTVPGATRDLEFQVVRSGEGCDRDGTKRLHFWAWTRVHTGQLGDHWADALAKLGVHTAGVLDIVLGVELMGTP